MPIVTPDQFDVVERPELFVALAAPVGTPIRHVCRILKTDLEARGYTVHEIRLSDLIQAAEQTQPPLPVPVSEYERISSLMDRGNALRSRTSGGEVLGVLATAEIARHRTEGDDLPLLDGHAFILNQLKHPDEVAVLRRVYGEAFHLIGVYSPEGTRARTLQVTYGMSPDQAADLIRRDQGEPEDLGQQLRDTFHLADMFVRMTDPDDADHATADLERYLRLLFADLRRGVESPTADEYGMYLAQSAALRSADLSRQVGAAILGPHREVVSVGCNEVPAAGGGQYWCDHENDHRDFKRGADSNALKKLESLREILEVVDGEFGDLEREEQLAKLRAVAKRLGPTRIMNLTEFGRAVHAEMEALLAAGRLGTSVQECVLYTTTFPCHNCAKHIVGAGIARVVYVEPYPKSLAMELHDDSIALDAEIVPAGHLGLESFVGVAPRRFEAVFSMLSPEGDKYRRKTGDGQVLRSIAGLRTRAAALNYMQREAVTAAALQEFLAREQQVELDLG